MAFVPKRLFLPIIAVCATAGFLIAGKGMEPQWPLMWIAFLPLLWYSAEAESWFTAGAAAASSMLIGSYPMLPYLHGALHAPVSAWLLPFGVVSLIFGVDVLLFRALLRCGCVWSAAIAFPAFWAFGEYLGSFVPANGTAGELAYTQLRFLPLLQLASVTGPWGISFLLLWFPAALVACFCIRRTQPRQARAVVTAMLVTLGAVLVFGEIRLSSPPASKTVPVGLLVTDSVDVAEPGAPAEALLREYALRAEDLARRGAQIVVMPEKVAELVNGDAPNVDALLQSAADRAGVILVVGLLHIDPPARLNEARIFQPHKAFATYHKWHMLPPFESDLTPGTSLGVLRQGSVGVAICKDMDFIKPAHDYGRAGVALMLDPAWDFEVDRAWHGHIAIMRGVEDGFAVAHASKHGFLTVSDDRGRILGEVRSGIGKFASLLVNVPMRHDDTVFSRIGAWFPWVAAVLVAVACVQLAMRVRTNNTEPFRRNPRRLSTEGTK